MDSSVLKQALKDPKSVPVSELDEILEAQLQVLKDMKPMEHQPPKPNKKKTKQKRARSRKLKNFQNRI